MSAVARGDDDDDDEEEEEEDTRKWRFLLPTCEMCAVSASPCAIREGNKVDECRGVGKTRSPVRLSIGIRCSSVPVSWLCHST